jgi:hypothetical protein
VTPSTSCGPFRNVSGSDSDGSRIVYNYIVNIITSRDDSLETVSFRREN